MAGAALTTTATLLCPHGGSVTAVASGRASAGASVLTLADTFLITGCPFTTPTTGPSPCVRVSWTVSDSRVSCGAPTLSTGSVGLCLSAASVPQGAVQIVSTQARVSTR